MQKSWQEHEREQLVRKEGSWGAGEILGLVLVVVREEARIPFLVVAYECVGLKLDKIQMPTSDLS